MDVIKGQWWQVTGWGGLAFIYLNEDGASRMLNQHQYLEVISEEPELLFGQKSYIRVRRLGSDFRGIDEGWVYQQTFRGLRLKLYFKSNDPKPQPALLA